MDTCIRQNKCIYNMEKILTSVDYFSQLLSLEQILSYGYEFFHDTLGLKASAIYYLDDDTYKLVSQIGYDYDIKLKEHKKNDKINNIATLYGRILYENFQKYFDEDFVDYFDPELIIPLIVKDKLYGFIISDGFCYDNNPYSSILSMEYLEGMKTLLNMALSNTLLYRDYKKLARNIDKELFQQFSINQTTKILLAETDIEKLYSLCIDVVRELTSSSVTALILHDSIRNKFIVKGYSDIINFQNYYNEYELLSNSIDIQKTVFDLDKDMDELKSIFKNSDALKNLTAKYVVLIGKNPVMGFITVGEPVSGSVYDDSTLNQIENVGKTVYLALKNANYIAEIKQKEKETALQLKNIKKLNSMIRNINSCLELEELMEITLKTLAVGYKVKQAAIVLKDYNGFLLKSIGYKSSELSIKPHIFSESYDEVFYSQNTGSMEDFINISIEDAIESNCMILLPIKSDYIGMDDDSVLGYLVITKLDGIMEESHIVIFETLASSITPVIKQFLELRRFKIKD